MGTSLAYSGTRIAGADDLRDLITDWFESGDQARPGDDVERFARSAAGLWSSGSGGSVIGVGAAGGSSNPARDADRIARTAGSAGSLANAFIRGDRQAILDAGLDFDVLAALGDPNRVVLEIVDAALGGDVDGDIEGAEEWLVSAAVVRWVVEFPPGSPPSPEQIARKALEEIIRRGALTEVGERIRSIDDRAERAQLENSVRLVAQACVSGIDLSGAATSDLRNVIARGISTITTIYGGA
jgi:hypothetical protein